MTAWGTKEIRDRKPTPLDEVRGGLVLFEHSLWHAVPSYLRDLDRALTASTGRGLPIDAGPIRFGSWIAGDRDGNPSVTPEVTRHACLLHRWMAADLYLRELEALREELAVEPPHSVAARCGWRRAGTYRALLRTVRDRMTATRSWIRSVSGKRRRRAPRCMSTSSRSTRRCASVTSR